MSATEFPFIRLRENDTPKPIVWVLLTNAHKPSRSLICPALTDTGADCTTVPHTLCRLLGHVFAKGTQPSLAYGVGKKPVRAFSHSSILTVLQPSPTLTPNPSKKAFGPLSLTIEFIEQDLPFLLLGQEDFLEHFAYHQVRALRRFSLRPYEGERGSSK